MVDEIVPDRSVNLFDECQAIEWLKSLQFPHQRHVKHVGNNVGLIYISCFGRRILLYRPQSFFYRRRVQTVTNRNLLPIRR